MSVAVRFAALTIVAVSAALASSQNEPPLASQDSEELKLLFAEDQADRRVEPGAAIDWNVVSARDEARELRVKELLAANRLHTGADYFHAGMVLQHSTEPDDYLLCHDLCIVAISKGEMRAKWLAAASMDRFLVSIGRPQRFGTQFRTTRPGKPMKLSPVDPSVSDDLRRAFDVPPLSEAKKREASMNAPLKAQTSSTAP